MNNDLISRSELKKACSEMVRGSNNSDFIPCPTWNNAMELIDNAPTVCGNNPKWCESCVSKGKCASTRPQGEWIVSGYIDTCRGYVAKCSCCKEDTVGGGDFCPNCGAKMKGLMKNEQE